MLKEALTDVVFRAGIHDCVVISGVLDDPYTGTRVVFAKEDAAQVQVDHVMALALAWDRGASRWVPERRRDFANDPDNLVVTTAAANQSKGDRSPADWLPSNHGGQCLLAGRFLNVARRWQLPITQAENDTISRTLQAC